MILDNREVFLMEPDFSSNPKFNLVRKLSMFDGRTGRDFGVFEGKIGLYSNSFKYVLHSREEIDAIDLFFNKCAGRYKDFWLPSWRNELEILNSTTNTITINNVNYQSLLNRDSLTGKYIFIYTDEGVFHVNKVTNVQAGIDTQVIELENELIDLSGEYICGIMYNMRLTDDSLNYSYSAFDKCTVELGFIENVIAHNPETKSYNTAINVYKDYYESTVSFSSDTYLTVLMLELDAEEMEATCAIVGSSHNETVLEMDEDIEDYMEATSGIVGSSHIKTVVEILIDGFDYDLDLDFSTQTEGPTGFMEVKPSFTSTLNSV